MDTLTDRAGAAVDADETDALRISIEGAETRWADHVRVVESDPTLSPRQRAWQLDRTLWDTSTYARQLGITNQRVSLMRTSRRKPDRIAPHPSVVPETDGICGYTANVPDPGVFAGRARRWVVQRGTHVVDDTTGDLIKESDFHPGAARAERVTRAKPVKAIPEQSRNKKK